MLRLLTAKSRKPSTPSPASSRLVNIYNENNNSTMVKKLFFSSEKGAYVAPISMIYTIQTESCILDGSYGDNGKPGGSLKDGETYDFDD